MLKFEAVAILMHQNDENIEYLVGAHNMKYVVAPLKPFDDCVCEFLYNLSSELMNSKSAKEYSDVISFAFWCRKANIENIKKSYVNKEIRLGLGNVFHIAPSNVPVNFAFSFVFSLLAGNANIVRIPTKHFPQVTIICDTINKLFELTKYGKIARMTAFVRYDKNEKISSEYSSRCNGRVIWGGDETIRIVRQNPIPVRSVDVAFADRYSFCIMRSEAVVGASRLLLKKLVRGFYNDTFFIDQNACSSPQLIIWIGNDVVNKQAQELFWNELQEIVTAEYLLPAVRVVDKYVQLCIDAIKLADNVVDFCKFENYIYRIQLSSLDSKTDELRGKFGYFFEHSTDGFDCIADIVNSKYQTLTYFGFSKEVLADFLVSKNLSGIDRIVPVGAALDISVVWDGYDLIRTLSRVCEVV